MWETPFRTMKRCTWAVLLTELRQDFKGRRCLFKGPETLMSSAQLVSLTGWMAPFSDYGYLNVSQLFCTMLAPYMLEAQGLLTVKQPVSRIKGNMMTLPESSLIETDLEKCFFAALKGKTFSLGHRFKSKSASETHGGGRVSERDTERV